MDLEATGLVRGGLPQKLHPGGQALQTACFLSVLAPVLSRPVAATPPPLRLGVFRGPQEPEHPVCRPQPPG